MPIADGTPASVVEKPEPPDFTILNTVSRRKYVELSPEMPGTPGAKGMITMTMNLVDDPALPDLPLPLPRLDPDDPEIQARLDEVFEEFKDTVFLLLSATVWDHSRTRLTIYPNGKADEAVTAVSNLDFNHFSGFSSFRVTDRDGRFTDYNLIMGIGNSDSHAMARTMAGSGLEFVPPEFPELADLSVGGPEFVVIDGPGNGEAAATFWRLHDLYRSEGARMEAAYHAREAARKKRKAYLIANPLKPEDVTVNFWRRSGPSNLEKQLKEQREASR